MTKKRWADHDGRYEVRYATLDNGAEVLDEVVAKAASVHLEAMSESCWLLILEWADGTRLDVTLHTKRAHIHGRAELDSGRPDASDDPVNVLAAALAAHCGDPSSEARYRGNSLGRLVSIAAARLVDATPTPEAE